MTVVVSDDNGHCQSVSDAVVDEFSHSGNVSLEEKIDVDRDYTADDVQRSMIKIKAHGRQSRPRPRPLSPSISDGRDQDQSTWPQCVLTHDASLIIISPHRRHGKQR